jgi:hypothetical protein
MMKNTSTYNNAEAVHIKVELDNEFRRFSLTTPTFNNLESTLRTLYNLGEGDLKIKFLDDEKDWILLSSDQELQYALELNGTPLRLSVKVSSLPAHTEAQEASTESSQYERRGRGRGGRGRGARDGPALSPNERLERKTSRLTERIAFLEEKINSNTLTSDRERVLRWRLEQVQHKLAFVRTKKDNLMSADQDGGKSTEKSTEPGSDFVPEPTKVCGRGRGRGRGGRGGRGRGCFPAEQPEATPVDPANTPVPTDDTFAHFFKCKTALKAARESGNKEDIKACQAAFREAKQAKAAHPKMARLLELRAEKRQCLLNLRQAQASGDATQIKACKEELASAAQAIHDVKASTQ